MRKVRRRFVTSVHSLILLALLAIVPGVAFAQTVSAVMSENARAKAYGSGWDDRGYRAVKDACVAVKMPENAHIDYSGNNWDCNPPYRKRQKKCKMLEEIGQSAAIPGTLGAECGRVAEIPLMIGAETADQEKDMRP